MTNRRRSRNGQVTVEMMLGMILPAIAFVVMAGYLQRSYQGYLRQNASGSQFDPTQPHAMSQTMQMSNVLDVDIIRVQPSVNLPSGGSNLPSVPGGPVSGTSIETKVIAVTDMQTATTDHTEAP